MASHQIETLLSCYVMVLIVISAIAGTSMYTAPFVRSRYINYAFDSGYRLAEYWLINPGVPTNWGEITNLSLENFGLAKNKITLPYELDIDKVSRLNDKNRFHIDLFDAVKAMNIRNRIVKIKISLLFNIHVNMTGKIVRETSTVYQFKIRTEKDGWLIDSEIRYYVTLESYIYENEISSQGTSVINFSLPNYLSGIALLVVFARAGNMVVSYATYSFSHNVSQDPNRVGSLLQLSPLNFTLYIERYFSNERITNVRVFSYNYTFEIERISDWNRLMRYRIPKLLDSSILVIVVSGYNETDPFVEWTTYPQIPLVFGCRFDRFNDAYHSTLYPFIVTVHHALYNCEIILGGS